MSEVIAGDCVTVMAGMEPDSFDAIVTDPPYQLSFMGKEWDRRHEHEPWAREALRVAKPGAHLLAFGGTRTYHRLTSALEDAGWEIRDCLVWAYASGFPKSLDVSKAIDKAAGAERPVVRERNWHDPMDTPFRTHYGGDGPDGQPVVNVTAPATDAAHRWQGWGTALKPAWEPIVLARKPLVGTVATNVTRYGTGALNIDGTRIAGPKGNGVWGSSNATVNRDRVFNASPDDPDYRSEQNAAGRWPPNLLLTDAELFDVRNDGVVGSGASVQSSPFPPHDGSPQITPFSAGTHPGYGDTGGYARFFLVPKASRSDREPEYELSQNGGNGGRFNLHATVKPVDLMRHLVRLVTPPGGRILDPFLGSGTTAIAAIMEGFECVGIEREPEYVAIAEARLNGVQVGMGLHGDAARLEDWKALHGD